MSITSVRSTRESTWSKNPDTLPRVTSVSANIGFKTAVGTVVLLNASGAQTTLANYGATATITANDTYVTVCDVTGSGFLFNVISAAGGATDLRTIRITIDGVVYTIVTSDAIAANNRLILGPVLSSNAIATTDTAILSSHVGQLGGYNYDFFAARDGGCMTFGTGQLLIPTENEILSRGLAAVRFDYSLKVEAKSETKSATADPYNAAIALYRLDL